MKLTRSEHAAINRLLSELQKILRAPQWPAMQIRLNVNQGALGSVDYKLHDGIQIESAVDSGRAGAQT